MATIPWPAPERSQSSNALSLINTAVLPWWHVNEAFIYLF